MLVEKSDNVYCVAYGCRLYEEAVKIAGSEFRSDRLWESYLDWVKVQNDLPGVIQLYDRVLAMPTQQHMKHFDQFRDFVYSNPPQYLMSPQEYQALWTEVNQGADGSIEGDASRGLERVKEKLLSQRQMIFQRTEEEVQKRWSYEEGVQISQSTNTTKILSTLQHLLSCCSDKEALLPCEGS
jgi:pre-mRNA-processing factor 39